MSFQQNIYTKALRYSVSAEQSPRLLKAAGYGTLGVGAVGAVQGLFSSDSSVVGGGFSGGVFGAGIGAGLGLATAKSKGVSQLMYNSVRKLDKGFNSEKAFNEVQNSGFVQNHGARWDEMRQVYEGKVKP